MNARERFFKLLKKLMSSENLKKDMEEIDRVIEEDRKLNHMETLKRIRIMEGDRYLNNIS